MKVKTNTLFALARGKDIECVDMSYRGSMKVGQKFNPTPLSASTYNKSSDITLTVIGKLFDTLLVENAICAFKSDVNRRIYTEINCIPIATDGRTVWCSETISPRRYFYAIALWNCVFSDAEAKDVLKKIVSDFASKGNAAYTDILKFCDNFYYSYIKNNNEFNKEEIVISEYEAAMRSGELQYIDILDDVKTPICMIGEPIKRKKQRAERKPLKDMYPKKDCLDGKFKLPYAWSSEAESYIPKASILKQYVPSDEYYKILNKITKRLTNSVIPRMVKFEKQYGAEYDRIEAIGDDYINLTLCGKPGTGKSIMVHALAATLGMPIYVINNSQNTDEDTYEGMTKMVDGKPTAVPTDVVKAFKNGGICLLEEINLPHAAVVMGALGQAVEFPFILKEDGYKTIRRHPLCVFISTMNVGTAGSKTVSQPFASRFKQSYRIPDPKKEDFIQILMSRTGAEKRICSWVYTCYDKLTKVVKENPMADVDTILMTLSLRSCIGAIENIQEGYEPKESIADSIIGKIAENDLLVAESCDDILASVIPDLIL